MAAAHGHASPALIEELFAHPEAFDFFQAVRVLEHHGARQGRSAVGGEHLPERESVRFRVRAGLAFATSEVQGLSVPDEARAPELWVSFFGYIGPAGVLPQHYTELAIARLQQRDATLRDFLDVFHHRMIALFHRAWSRSRLAPSYERQRLEGKGEDAFSCALASLVGIGLPSLSGRRALDDAFLLYASGQFSSSRRTALGLAQVIADLCAVPAAVEELVGRWLEIPPEERTLLGPRDARSLLGGGATLGARVWDVQRSVRLVLGPLSRRDFEHLRPGGAGHPALASAIDAYLGAERSCDLRFVLAERESPGIELNGRSRLGANAWLEHRTRPEQQRRADFRRGQGSGVKP
ncbi:MAG: type VI secretion system baseplate subunit TssG [Planctomycetes bacterium]|nr:type VI secretion system baseplate subunit TssG [Planctomycetota bacterium]